jgi:probable phosphoglycerate mutase
MKGRQPNFKAGVGAEIDPDLVEWDYGKYEGRRTADIRAERPRLAAIPRRVPRRRITRASLRAVKADVLLFSSGHFIRVLDSRWIGAELSANASSFMLSTASLSALGYEHDFSRPSSDCGMTLTT